MDTLTRFVADRRKLLVLDTRSMIDLSRTELDRPFDFAYDRPRLGEMQRYVARQSPPGPESHDQASGAPYRPA